MKYLIVGLGNVGAEYENTRHNIGFTVVEDFAAANNATWTSGRLAYMAEVKYKGRILILVKPTTFMNLSGKAVNYWVQAEKIFLENLLVITDDLALPFGKVRLREKGSDGGHNGLKSIQEHLITSDYARLRFGVGNNFAKGRQVDHVLGKWNEEEKKELAPRIELCSEMIKSFVTVGAKFTMTNYNNK